MTGKSIHRKSGTTLIELMVALAIGSILIAGAISIYTQSRRAYAINESVARVQEIAQFAMDTLESELMMAGNWGKTSHSFLIEGRSLPGEPNPNGIDVPTNCGDTWALDLARPVDGSNNAYRLACIPGNGAQASSDVITLRRVSVTTAAPEAGRVQIQSNRSGGQLFSTGAVPADFSSADSVTHNLVVSSYYVSPTTNLVAGTPALRRRRLVRGPRIVDEEIAPGVENIQLQLGIDVNEDGAVDRFVNPGDPAYDPNAVAFIEGTRVIAARVWLVVRGPEIEPGIRDAHEYRPGDVDLGTRNDGFRRLQISKTILLRNART